MVTEKDVIHKSVLKSALEEKEGNLKLLKLNQSLQQTAHPGILTSSLQNATYEFGTTFDDFKRHQSLALRTFGSVEVKQTQQLSHVWKSLTET